MRLYDDALVLRRTPFRETSLIIHFFTRNNGLLTALAKGVRVTTRHSRAALAGFHTVSIGRQSRSMDALGTLIQVDVLCSRNHLIHSSQGLMAAQVVQETLYRYMPPLDPRPEVFELVEWSLDQLDAGQDPLSVAAICQGRLLRGLGYGWRTDCCVGCGVTEALNYFSVRRGQMVCKLCAAPYIQRLFFVDENVLDVMRSLEWSADYMLLCPSKKEILYRMAMDSLYFFGKRPLLSDQSFRQMLTRSVHTNPDPLNRGVTQ